MSMDVDKCRLESMQRWSKIDIDLQKIKDEQDVLKTRLDKQAAMVADIQQLSTSVALLANNMKEMLKEQQKLASKIEALESKPAKRWDSIVDKALMVIVAALVGALLIKLGIPM